MGNWWDEQQKPTGSLASLQPITQPPSFDSAVANNPYATQLAQGLQAYRNRPSRFSTEPASLPAPAQPPEADKPAFDLGNSLSALYEGATEQFIPGIKSALAQAYTGLERPDRNPEWATRFMEEGRQAQQQADQRTAELQRQGQSDSTSEAIRSAIPSLGFSLGSMAAAIPAGLAGAAATQAAIPIPGSGLVGGALAAGAASGVAGYRMAGSQFLNDTFAQMEQESQKQRGRGLTEQEKATAYQELRPVAENTGLWEAGPEAIGNAALLGLGRVALGLMPKEAMQNLAASALGRAGVRTGAAAGALATEVGTEGVTQFAQGNDQQKGQAAVDALLSGKDMKTAMAAVDPQYQGFQGLVQSTKDVAPATIATVLLMGGLAKPGHMAYSALQDRAETNRRGEQTDEILANTQPFRAALDRADAADLSQVLSAFNQIREAGKIPKSAMERLDSAQSAVEAELTRKQAIESQVAADTGQQGAPIPIDFLGPANADPLADQIAAEDRRAQQSADFNANPRSIGSLLNDWNQRESMRAGAVQGGIAADRARLSEIAQQQVERQRQETLADRTQAIQQQEADRRARLNAEIATRGAPGELARLLGPETQAPTPRQEAPAPQSLSDLLNRPSQSSAVPTARAGERGSLSDLFPQQRSTNRNWWDTELSPSKVTTETPAPPKSGWARFGNETGTLNIPRAEMPQVKAEHRGALVNFLNARGVAHEADTEVDPATLKPTQAEFSPQKVRKAINYQGGDRSILVSSDGYVLDGHHQWLAALEQGKPIKAIRLDAPIANLLPLTREFPSSTVSTASSVRGGQTGRAETPTTAAPTQPEIPNEARKAEAEAAPLLNQAPDVIAPQPEDSGVAPSPAKTAKGAAPLWNRANEAERIALLRQPSGPAGSSVSEDFARRKAAEWKTWADIPEGPAKNRLREALKNQEIQNAIENPSASPPDGGVGAQPSIRQEGGNPAERSQGIQQGGQENRNPAQEVGEGRVSFDVKMATGKQRTRRVENARLVDLGIPGITGDEQFAVHPSIEKKGYVVSHIGTGLRVVSPQKTEEAAISEARARLLRMGKDTFDRAVQQGKPANKKTSAKPSKQPNGEKADWEMTKSEWLGRVRFYRSGKTKNAELPGGTRVILDQGATAKNFRDHSARFLLNMHESGVKLALSEGKNVPAAVLAEYPDLRPSQPTVTNTPAGPATARPAGPGTTAIELPVGAGERPAPQVATDYGKSNTIFTEDAAAKARAILKAKLGQLSAGIDPEIIQAGITLAGYHIEAGAREFSAYAKAMLADLGEQARPFLRSWYEGVRHYPGFSNDSMTASSELDADEAAPSPQKKSTEATIPKPPTAVQLDNGSTTKESTNEPATDQGKQPGVGAVAPRRSDTTPGRREGGRPEPSATGGTAADLATEPPANVEAPEGQSPRPSARNRAPGPVSQGTSETPEGGNGATRRSGTGNGGLATDDAGRTGSTGTELKNGGVSDAAPVITYPNYHISDPKALVGGGPKARFNKNRRAIETWKELTETGLQPTPEQLDALAAYTGWGSFGQELFQGTFEHPRPKPGWADESQWMRDTLGKSEWESAQRSILNAHYTDPPTVNAMWNLARKMGFSGGRVLEPSMGIGNFFGLMPRDLMGASQLTGIELDEMTAGMVQRLYPDAIVRQMGYQDSKTADHFYDLVIGNWPFARQGPIDRRYRALSPSLHDYFFLKAVDQVRPGGLVIGVTSAFTMDKKGEGIRRELAKKAELVASFRLPTGAFEDYAGTKVVTDIIILKKRDTPLQSVNDESWVRLGTTTAPSGAELSVNQYYIEHPDQVLGVMDIGHGTTTGAPGLIVNRPDRYGEMLSQIADRVDAGIYEPRTTREVTRYLNEETKDRQQSATIGNDGQLYQVQGDRLARLEDVQPYTVKSDQQTADRAAQIRGLIALRRQTNALFSAERDATVGDARVEELRADLKKGYQDFVAKHGPVNESFGLKYLNKLGDPYQADLAALETWNGKDWKPATALNRPTTRGKKTMERPSVADALVLARNERSDIDIARIAELANTTPDKAANTLLESGAIFQAPDGRYEVADQYLSGNVRRKLREAQAAKADGVEGMDRNIAALEQVIPKTVPYYNIEARMGAPWVPVEDYGDFVKELLGANTESDGLPISFIAGRWKVGKSAMFSMARGTPWQTDDVSFRSLLSAALNVRTLTVKRFDPVDKTTYVDEAATKEVNQKVTDLREAFTTWLWKTPDRQVRLEKVYNEIMNAMAAPEFDGSFLNFEGMALQRGQQPFNLRQHQIDAIYRGIANRRGLYAHEVGTGKTYTIAGVAVESRRYGLSRKPLILAHNANSKAVADGIVEMYPNAKVLYINNLDSKSIETKLRQIKMDDWDAVVVPHSLIERFALTRETLMDLAQEQIDALEEEAYTAAEEDMGAQGERLVDLALDGDESAFKKLRSPSAKDLVRARNQIIAKIEDHAQRASREGAVPFEELGIDSIIVDEAHLFKKPPLETRMKMRGLNTATSNRGLAMSFLTNYIKKINGGKGVHLFTGTPITNTLSETFHMMRYVMDDEMRRDGLQNWDGWFNTFASETNDIEITAAGEYEPVTRLASFINVADLRRMMAPYTDIVFADDMPEFKPRKTRSGKTMADTLTDSERAELLQGRDEEAVGRPYKKVVVDSAEMTPEQAAIMALLTERARRFRAASRKERREIMLSGSPESPLLVETAAANAGLDQRLFKEKAYEGSPNSKAARAVRNLLTHYREHPKTTQVVFMERGFEKSGFNLAKSIVDDLVAGGIPRKEIAIVDGSTSADRRKAVADAMNRAEIRVVIGNTQTLGVGVNMQANLRAMHHLDAPWTPADLEQRNGRGHRQGNAWNTVMEYRYLTERIDGRRWQVLAVKDRFIKSFLKADENTRVIEGDAVDDSNQSDIVSTLSEAAGDPRILIINKLKADLEKLHARERMHGRAVVDAKREIDHKLQRESAIQARIDAYQRYQEVADKAKQSEEPAYLIDGTRYADRKDAQTALDEFISRKAEPTGTSPKKIGQVYGLDLSYMWSGTQSMGPIFYVGSKGSPLIDMGRATILSAENAVWSLPRRIKEEGDALSENQRSVENLRRVVREPFGRAEELKRKADQLQRVEQDVQNNPVPPPGWLRNGAPVDSVAYHQGKPYVVTGHRWTAVNYSVELQSDDGKTQRAVPYDEVTDAQNIPLYEPHPFVAPDIAEKNRESRPTRGLSSATPITPAQTRADLSRTLGADVVARLEQSGRLVIHDKPPTGAAAGAQGWVDQKGVIHLVPANLESSALSVVLHESAHLMRDDRFSPESRALGRAAHAVLRMSGLQGLIGNPSYNDLIQQVYRLAAEGNKTAQAALAKATVEPGNTAEEALSYIVEYADEKLPIYRRIMSAIRAALYRLGIKVNLTPADLRALALSALKSRAKEVTARNAQPAFSLPDFAPTEADRVEVERQMKAVKEVRDDQGRLLAPNGKQSKLNERQWKQVRTQFFKDWFGDWQNDPANASKVVDENGEPMVVYHGSPDARFMSSDATFKSQAERYGFGSPIGVHWFASSEQTAKTYADERRAFDYQNAEPGIVAAFLNIRDAIEINANGKKWREAQKVGKTSSVIDKAQTEGRDGVIIENVKDDYQTGAIKGSRATTTFSVFSSAQIKSAIGNAGTFSPRSNRIDYSQVADEAEQDQFWREFQAVRAQFQAKQDSQSAFERWFGQGVEGVNVHKGQPLTLFHGTNNPEFNRWDESLSGQASRHPTAGLGFFMTADARSAARYGSRLLELNAKINKPYFMTDADLTRIEDTKDAARFRRKLQAQGYDAAVIVAPGAAPYVVAFQSSQVKLTSNTNPTESDDFRYSRPHRWADGLPAEIASMAEKIGAEPKPWIDRLRDMRDSLPTRIRQGTIDRFARLLENDRARFGRDVIDTDTALSSWVAAKMSKSPEGALEAAFLHGRIKWDNGAINVQETKQGLAKALEPISSAGELNRFWQWIIAKRSNRLMQEGRERLFTPQEIASGLTLNSGTMADGNDRNAVYRRAFSRYVEIQKSVLDVAEQSGLFNADQRAQWEHDFYLPYYRVIEDEGELRGPSNGGGKLVRQKAFEKLKGGTEKLGDPLQNILRNWHHLIDASLKNRAASLALDTAETLGAAQLITSSQTDKHSVWIMKNGDKEYYRVDDPLTLDAVSALSSPLLNNMALKPFAFLKRALTIGVTISPAFKAANLLRDSIATMAISTISPNVFKVNPIKGMMLAREGAPTQASLLAGGGTFRFGTLLEGDPAAAARRIAGWKPDTVLDSPEHIRGFYDLLKKGTESWTRFGDLMETANRASLYDQLRKEGKTHLQASLAARDIMDFSQSGSAMATRLLVGVVPFINARLQGMDVLYRKGFQPLSRTVTGRASAIERQQALRFAAATFAVAAASVLLYLNYKDDDDFQKREQWDRDNYWWFKIGDTAYRIPKPFEVGALGTMAERIVEQIVDKNASGKLFADRLKFMLTQTFSMDPTPQLIKPIIDVYANKDSFTKRPIEPMGMENLSPELRSRYNTSALAIAASKAGLGKAGLSPLQIEHLTRGYFGWLGAQALLIGDYGARPVMGLPNRPIKQSDIPVIGDLLQRFKPDGRGSRYITEFYEQAKQLRQIAADARLYLQLRDYDALNKLIAKQGNELQQSFAVEAVARKFGEFGRLEREIARDKSMSGDEKRRLIDELNKNKSNVAKQVMEKLR